MTVLVYLEHAAGAIDEPSRQAATLARSLAAAEGPEPVVAVLAHDTASLALEGLSAVGAVHLAVHETFASYAPRALAEAVVEAVRRTGMTAVVGPGTERGNEVLAHVAALLDLPLATNCVAARGHDVTRVRWGGSLLEEARLDAPVLLMTVQPQTVAADAIGGGTPTVETFTPALSHAARALRVVERVGAQTGGVSLADARVVVSGGRGAGSAEGFAPLEELAELLGAAVGCSRAATMAGWRSHRDQVGQTGTKIAPELYVACGISGATQHMAGCRGARKLLAINTDREAPILQSADYAVIGDLHEVVPAISAAIRATRT